MEEPQIENPPQVRDRDDRVWTKRTTYSWTWTFTDEKGITNAYDMPWEVLERLLGPLTRA